MYGVVLWTDKKRGRAVVWCDDHDRLAFMRDRSALTDSTHAPQPGDLVKIRCRDEGQMRYCTAVTLVGSGNFANLPRSLVEATQAVVSQARRSQDAQIEDLSRHIDVSRSAPCVIQIAQG